MVVIEVVVDQWDKVHKVGEVVSNECRVAKLKLDLYSFKLQR